MSESVISFEMVTTDLWPNVIRPCHVEGGFVGSANLFLRDARNSGEFLEAPTMSQLFDLC